MEDARSAARDSVVHAYSSWMYRPTLVGLNWGLSGGTIADRVAVMAAAEDAAIAEVARDVVPPEIYERLRGPFDLLDDMRPPPVSARSLSTWAGTSRRFPMLVLSAWLFFLAVYASQFGALAVGIPVLAATVIVAAARSRAKRAVTEPDDDPGPIDLPRPILGTAGIAAILVGALPFIATGSAAVIVAVEVTAVLAIAGVIVWIRAARD